MIEERDDGVAQDAHHLGKIPRVRPDAPPPPEAGEVDSPASDPVRAPGAEDTVAVPVASGPKAAEGDETQPIAVRTGPEPGDGHEVRPAAPRTPGGRHPKLAEGIELQGAFEDSGYQETPYLARRADGQVIQLTLLLHLVAEACDGSRDSRAIAEVVSEKFGRKVSARNVDFLVEKKLRPLGVLAQADGSSPKLKKADPLLALKFKTVLLPEKAVNLIAALLRPLFWPPVILTVLGALIAFDIWYFGVHGIGESMRDLIYRPGLVLLIYGLLILSIAWHELGHATACRYGGATPGVIGFGIYVVWPAFYNDVTDAYRLGKVDRVRVDLGGIYFNMIFSLATAGVYFLTGFEPLLVLIVIQHVLMLYQFMPFLRLDGYYVISDIAGVPDLFGRVKPTLRSMIPGRETEKPVAELKPWVRRLVMGWVLTVIPVLLFLFGMMVLSAPRVLATGYDSFMTQSDKIQAAASEGENTQAAASGIQAAFLVLPLLGMTITFSRVAKRIVQGGWNITEGRPVARGGLAVLLLGCLAFAGFVLWPNGEYKPIQPGEKWTVASGFEALSDVSSGRPSLTTEREEQLGGAPKLKEQELTDEATAPAPEETETPQDLEPSEEPEASEDPEPVESPTESVFPVEPSPSPS